MTDSINDHENMIKLMEQSARIAERIESLSIREEELKEDLDQIKEALQINKQKDRRLNKKINSLYPDLLWK
jgi:chromosome segregation ATPase